MKFNKSANKLALFLLLIAQLIFSQAVFSQYKAQKIDELVNKYNELGQFNGAVLVAENGNIIYSKGIGYADMENKIPNKTDTKFRIASVTKQFTATLIMQLVEKGKIKLDGKLSKYLPYYRKDTGDKITIHQILSHTSGLANYTDNPEFMQDEVKNKVTPKDFVLRYCSAELAFEPGTDWAYSNSGYFILGAIIEEVTGKTYEAVLQENILTPLEMSNSGYENTGKVYDNYAKGYENLFGEFKPAKFLDMTIPYSAGSMYSTVEDMYKWDRALYTEKILAKASLEKMFSPVMNDYGYGWMIGQQPIGDTEKKVTMHSGGIFGFSSIEIRLVDDGHYIMILSNFETSSINQLSMGIADILYNLEPPKPKKSLAIELSKMINEKGIDKAIAEFKILKEKKDEYRAIEREFNQLGYVLLQGGKVKEAIEVFKLNVQLYPESSNVYDSLGEAYAAAGDKENAIINYKKSIELNPENEHGKQILKELQAK
jgi:CubicO group peptidase (beta-lactamase class C family)